MDIQTLLTTILDFLNNTIIPFVYSLAFLVFFINVLRYFIIGAGNEESRESAKRLATWGLAAFVVIFSIWGIVNLLITTFGIQYDSPKAADYMCERFWSGCGGPTP
jgi:succinate dehydrogenase/fumarate reductase cytochrome b subunit